MLRNLIIVAAVIIVFLIVAKRRRLSASGQRQGPAEATAMVQCLNCNTYVPVTEAVRDGERQFCCQQHLRDWARQTK